MENPKHTFTEMNLLLQLVEESQIKSKTLMRWSSRQKRSAFFVTFILSQGIFFNICVLSQCIVYWINFQNVYTFTYGKKLLYTLLQLVFKIIESLQCILKISRKYGQLWLLVPLLCFQQKHVLIEYLADGKWTGEWEYEQEKKWRIST